MLGIALGAFTQGLTQGMQLGQQIHDVRKQRRLESAVQDISTQGKADYDAAVARGEAAPDDYMTAYTQHVVPKIANEYLLDGNPAQAQAWNDWADSTAAKTGSKKFMSGLSKFNNGDVQGGVEDMVKAANVQGYGPNGKVTAAEYFDEAAGKVTGYRLTFTTPDGQEHVKNVATGDLPSFFSNLANPKAAFEMEQASRAEETKATREVSTYRRKKEVDKQLGTGTGQLTAAQYQNAIQEERKAMENSVDPDISAMSSDEKEAKAKEIVDARYANMGQQTPAGDQIGVDPDTGEPVADPTATPDTPAPEDVTPAPTAPTPTPTADAAAAQPGITPPAPVAPQSTDTAPSAAPSPVASTSQVPDSQKQQYLMQASQLMKQGGDAQKIGRALIAAGIPPDQWPQDMQQAAQAAQPGISR